MQPRFAPLLVSLKGILCLGIGSVLRLQSGNLAAKATSGISPESLFESMSGKKDGVMAATMAMAQRSEAFHDIAQPLLWTGGTLMVIAAVAQLFLPFWLSRRTLPEQASPREVGHPVLDNLS